MMTSLIRRFAAFTGLVAALALAPAALLANDEHHAEKHDEHGHTVALADVPHDARVAIEHAAEHGEVKKVTQHEEHGHTVYTAVIHHADGSEDDVTVDAHGTVQHEEHHAKH
ncbi:hypothetical protein [Actomonas aquatica]|uniref:PepSY domain-containing protein n=1 Tax=Actomonas aquatica TaxID=2866162 RepID=A0ABZ1C3L8_9BACT|nr:hypothetical protein [Opitutus sp. WL0086]WRQ85955.1 hypothetical protein K1X11_014170 [Opitutus sp. WL0086]